MDGFVRDVLKEALRQKVQEAHEYYLNLRALLDQYIYIEERKTTRSQRVFLSRVCPEVFAKILPGETFTTKDFYNRLGVLKRYETVRCSLSTFLAGRVKAGELQKLSRAVFQRVADGEK